MISEFSNSWNLPLLGRFCKGSGIFGHAEGERAMWRCSPKRTRRTSAVGKRMVGWGGVVVEVVEDGGHKVEAETWGAPGFP